MERGSLLHPTRRQNRLTGEEQKPSLGSGKKQESSRDKNETPCRFKFCKNPSCGFWHPPACLNYSKVSAHGDKYHFRHVDGKTNKKSKKGGAKGSVAIVKECIQLGCAYQDSFPRKSILREPGLLGSKHAVKFKAPGTKKNFRKKGPSGGKGSPGARKLEDRSHEVTLHQERCARRAAWDLAKDHLHAQ